MSESPDIIHLGAEEEANRLWQGAKTAQESASEDFVALCEALDLGLRTAEVLVTHRLQPVKDQFPATIGIQLDTPSPEVEPHRDAITVPTFPSLHCHSRSSQRGGTGMRRPRAPPGLGGPAFLLPAVPDDRARRPWV